MAGAAYRRVTPRPLVSDGDMSADFTSEWLEVSGLNQVTIHYKWDGSTPVGELKVEADVSKPPHNEAIVFDVLLSPSADVAGDTGADTIVLTGPLSRFRVKYVRTSGTGSMDLYWQGHQV